MIETAPPLTHLSAIGVATLYYLEALAACLALGWFLEGREIAVLPVGPPGGGGVGAGAGGVIVFGMMVLGALLAGWVIAAAGAAVGDASTLSRFRCILAAAVGVQAFQFAHFAFKQTLALGMLLLAAGAVVLALHWIDARLPVVALLVLPAVTIALIEARVLPEQAVKAREEAVKAHNERLTGAMVAGDLSAIEKALQGPPHFVDWALWDATAAFAGRAGIDAVLRSPGTEATPCVRLLRAVGTVPFPPRGELDGFLQSPNPVSWRCREAVAQWGAIIGDTSAIRAVLAAEPALAASLAADMLRQRRFDLIPILVQGGLLGPGGKLRTEAYTEDFIRETLYDNDADDQWKALFPYLDPDLVLVCFVSARNGTSLLKRTLAFGANPNRLTPCGTTALATLMTKGEVDSTEVLDLLLSAGANVNIPGRPACQSTSPDPTSLPEKPLWLLARRYQARQDSPSTEFIRLLAGHGADVNERNAKGESPLGIFSKDPELATDLAALKAP